VLFLALSAAPAAFAIAITPTLEPTDDKVFFNKDYPIDHQPSAFGVRHSIPSGDKPFQYPYPVVQDSGEYEKDYVKDENDDSGEWKAQMDYDLIRSKVLKQKEVVKDALNAKDGVDGTIADAHGREAGAEKDAKDAEDHADSASDKEKHAIDKEHDIDGKLEGEVGHVDGDMDALKKCQEELAEAREKLEQLMRDKEALAGNRTHSNSTNSSENTAEETEEENEKDTVSKADAAEYEAAKAAAAAKQAELDAEIAEAQEAYELAMKKWEKQKANIAKLEADIDKAAMRLRKYRTGSKGSDTGGGVYPANTRSDAAVPVANFLLLCILGALA